MSKNNSGLTMQRKASHPANPARTCSLMKLVEAVTVPNSLSSETTEIENVLDDDCASLSYT